VFYTLKAPCGKRRSGGIGAGHHAATGRHPAAFVAGGPAICKIR